MRSKQDYQRQFWRSMSTGSLITVMLAIFFTFGTIGFASDIMSGGQLPLKHLFILIVYSGLVAVAYAYAGTQNPWYFAIVVPLHLAFHVFYQPNIEVAEIAKPLENRLFLDAFGIIILIAMGYVFFIIFISNQGTKSFKMATEMELARQMHEVLVPEIDYDGGGLKVVAQSLPALEVGGDLVDLYEGKHDTTCYIADISGHGVAASLLMGMFKSAMHTELQQEASLQKTLQEVNAALYRLKKRTMFLTAAVMRFAGKNAIEFAVLGHMPILHLSADKKDIKRLSQKQIPLAAQKEVTFQSETIRADVGDRFVLLTDGLTETTNKAGEEFGLEAVEKIVANNKSLSSKDLIDRVFKSVGEFGARNDDQTIMIIEVTG